MLLATGNQDCTARVWDIRMSGSRACVALIDAAMGAVSRVRFSPCGERLALAEPADLAYVLTTASGFGSGQVIDLFGELGGLDFDPDDSRRLFVGVADPGFGGLATVLLPEAVL
jgi:WD40 repeat protein